MVDYAYDISTDDYLYREEITITETGGEDRTNFSVKLSLTSSNFNFALARSDGYDMRIAEASNGTRVLNMWVASWDDSAEIGTIWLKVPSLLVSEVKTLYVYWGHTNASGVSDISEVGFLFADGFEGTSIDSSKWNTSGSYSVNNSKILLATDSYIESKGTPLSGLINWIIEEGVYVDTVGASTTITCHRYRFYGTENNFGFNFYREGDTDRTHSVVNSSTYVTYNGTDRGFDASGYSENYIGYKEPTDRVYQGMSSRPILSDYDDSWERKVYGDTRITYFRIYGRDDGTAHQIGIDWIVVREYFDVDPYSFDTSNLYVPYETVNHEEIDWSQYDLDVTSVNFYHTTNSGGDPYKLSDNISSAMINCWYSNDTANSADLIIDFGRTENNLATTENIHYDSGHSNLNNASRLSDNDDSTYFQGTTSSGYVCIEFDNNVALGCLVVRAVPGNLSSMVKNYRFMGSYDDPRLSGGDWEVFSSGQLVEVDEEQSIYFVNQTPYKYYKLEIIDTHDMSNVMLQEWQMYQYDESNRKTVISQLRLNPVAFDSQEIYFPKQIEIYGSNNMIDWTALLSTTNTATPFYDYIWGRRQRFSFTNETGYYNYKLICYGNWNYNSGSIAIAEWEMVEKSSEGYSYRILSAASNNFNSVWATSSTTFDDGFTYIGGGSLLNTVYNNRLVDSTTVSGIIDINVI